MKKQISILATLAVCLFLAAGCVGKGAAPGPSATQASGVPADHPQLSKADMQQQCFECHRDVTPDIYKEWWNSPHGIDNVRCFQCHGTYGAMKRVPDQAVCASCHNGEYHKRPEGSTCWQCHPAHAFHAHK